MGSLLLIVLLFFEPGTLLYSVVCFVPLLLFLLGACVAPVRFLFAPVFTTIILVLLTNPNSAFFASLTSFQPLITVVKVVDALVFMVLVFITFTRIVKERSVSGSLLDLVIKLIQKHRLW